LDYVPVYTSSIKLLSSEFRRMICHDLMLRYLPLEANPKITRQIAAIYTTCSVILKLVSVRSKSSYRSGLRSEYPNGASQKNAPSGRTSVTPVDVALWRVPPMHWRHYVLSVH